MQKISLIICFFFLQLISFSQSKNQEFKEEKSIRKTAIKFNVTDFFVDRFSLGIERKLSKSFSFELDVDLLNKTMMLESNHPWYEPLQVDKKGMIIEPQIRWYLFNDELKGVYSSLAGFFGSAIYHPQSGVLDNDDWSSIGCSLHVGYQLVFWRVIADTYLGFTLADDNYPGPYVESTALFPPPDGLRFSAGFRLGINF
jgi:hypothetical protein